jgi:hypothetical protein
LPAPSAPDAPLPGWLADEPDTQRWVRVLVPVAVPCKARRINVTIEESLLARLDNAARDHRMTPLRLPCRRRPSSSCRNLSGNQ